MQTQHRTKLKQHNIFSTLTSSQSTPYFIFSRIYLILLLFIKICTKKNNLFFVLKSITCFTCSQLAYDAEKYELNYHKDNPYTIITTESFPEKEMKRAEKIAKACEVFYNQGKAVPWFGIVIRALKMKPSKFFLQFANWEMSLDEEMDVLTKQVKFIEQMFFEQEQTNFAMIAADIITYFAKLDDFLEQDDVYDNGLKCSDNFDLYYNPNELQDIMDAGITELDDLEKNLSLSPCNVCFEYIQETDMIDIIFN